MNEISHVMGMTSYKNWILVGGLGFGLRKINFDEPATYADVLRPDAEEDSMVAVSPTSAGGAVCNGIWIAATVQLEVTEYFFTCVR